MDRGSRRDRSEKLKLDRDLLPGILRRTDLQDPSLICFGTGGVAIVGLFGHHRLTGRGMGCRQNATSNTKMDIAAIRIIIDRLTQPNRGEILQLLTALIRGNRRKGLPDLENLRTRARVLVPAALNQRPQTVRERRVHWPGRSVAPQHCLHDHPIRLLATERNLISEYLCWCSNS